MKQLGRIEIFDGLRVIAILMVLFFHYYYRFDGRFYNYSFSVPEFFKYGYLGVQLFFIISGFVIALTLTKCDNFITFIKKRFVRLIPAMFICSFLTFFVFYLFDSDRIFPQAHSISNLLISNTFINPNIINAFSGTNLMYIDGAYWSIWVELQFYVLAGIVYFLSPRFFLRNYSILTMLMIALYFFSISDYGNIFFTNLVGERLYNIYIKFLNNLSIFRYNLWFLIGIFINKIYFKKNEENNRILYGMLGLLFILQMVILADLYEILFIGCLMILFYLILHKPQTLKFLANKNLSKIGVASYSMYLIHQFIGVLIIHKFSDNFGQFDWLLALLVTVGVICFGLISYKFFEISLGKKVRNLLFFKTKPNLMVNKIPNKFNI